MRGEALYESSMRVTRPTRMTSPRCAADQPDARAWTMTAGSMPAAWPTAAPARALWIESLPSPGTRAAIRTGRPPRVAGSRSVKRIPSKPADATSSAADIGVAPEPVGQHPSGSPVRHPAHAAVVVVEHRDAIRRAPPRPARPWPSRSPRASPCGSGARPGPPSRRRSGAAPCGPGRRSRRPRTCPSRARRPGARGRVGAA